jgi:uncharacterized protein YbcI
MSSPVVTGVSPSEAISNLVVRVTREYTGRGPTKARTHIVKDLVSVVLEDTLTRGERTLVESNRGSQVLAMRLAYQDAMQVALVDGVQEILGREVLAFMSSNHIDPDMAIESFVLTPER